MDQGIDAPVLLAEVTGESCPGIGVAHVKAVRGQSLLLGGGERRLIEVRDDDGAVGGEPAGDGQADAAGSARYN
jgi:hypothetical protein